MRTEQQIRSQIAEIERYMQPFKRQIRTLKRALRKAKGFVTHKPGSFWRKGHEYIDDPALKLQRRIEIYRNAGGDVAVFDGVVEELRPAMCQGCAETHPIGWNEGEWSHPKSQGGRRCDCAEHSEFVCKPFHVRYHNRAVKSGKVDA